MNACAFLLLVATCGAGPSPRFEVRVLTGDPVKSVLDEIAADGSLRLAEGKAFGAGDWFSLRRSGAALPPWPRDPHVELTNGDRVRGVVAGADGDALRLTAAWTGAADQVLRFPLSSLRVAWLRSRPDDVDPPWLAGPRKRDVVISRNGDVALGALTAIDSAKSQVRFQADGVDRDLSLSRVAAIAFNTDLARVRRPKGPYYRLTLADGTRLSVTALTFDGRMFAAKTLFNDPIRVPADQFVSAEVEQGKAVYLSDLKPVKYQYASYDGETFPWMPDRSVTGLAMQLKSGQRTSTFDRGVGLHAECSITYALGGKYQRFEALVGLDARVGARGDAVISVALDRKDVPLPTAGRLTAAGDALTIRVDLAGAKELTIAIRKGNGGIVQDHVNLAEARLVP